MEMKTLKATVQTQNAMIRSLQHKNKELVQKLTNYQVADQLAAQAASVQEANWCSLSPGQLDEEAARLEWINREIGRFRERVAKLNNELRPVSGTNARCMFSMLVADSKEVNNLLLQCGIFHNFLW